MKNTKTRALVESAILIALATILSLIKLVDLPYGGSITIASMFPIVILSYRFGLRWGCAAGLVYGIIQQLTGLSLPLLCHHMAEHRRRDPARLRDCLCGHRAWRHIPRPYQKPVFSAGGRLPARLPAPIRLPCSVRRHRMGGYLHSDQGGADLLLYLQCDLYAAGNAHHGSGLGLHRLHD